MMKDYDECKIEECWKGQNTKLGGHRSFQYAQLSKGHDGLFQKVLWRLAAATIPLAEGHISMRGIISDKLFRE